MDDCPVEILEHITSFCDDRSILNLNKVSKIFYLITKKRKIKLEKLLAYYIRNKDNALIYYIIANSFANFKLVFDLNLINPYEPVFFDQAMCYWDGYESVGHVQLIDLCIRYVRFDFIELLISHDLDLNIKNSEGLTPLMKAVAQTMTIEQMDKMIVLLCENGADVNVENNYGYIAMDMINSAYDPFTVNDIKDTLRSYNSREGTIPHVSDWVNEYDYEDYD